MLSTIAGILLASILLVSAVGKLMHPRRGSDAMATFGFGSEPSRWFAWGVAILAELALSAGVAVRSDGAAYAAAGLMALFALTLGSAVMRGLAGCPCACFGGASKVGTGAIVLDLALAAGFAALPQVPDSL